MALPVPLVRVRNLYITRTKFMLDGMGFAMLACHWDPRLPPDPPDYVVGVDDWDRGDAAAVTHILYRIIEKDDDQLPDDDRDLILEDDTQHESDWFTYVADPTIRYRDVVFPADTGQSTITNLGASSRRHAVDMPNVPDVDATTKCYWVTAWLGVDADNILIGYDATP